MNENQLKKWKHLSLGLAKVAYPMITEARQKKLLIEIEYFIDLLITNFPFEDICDWDGNKGKCYVCDEMSDYLWDNRYIQPGKKGEPGTFGCMLSACIRAGFDVAVEPSAGVVGFTLGHLKSVFNGGLPDWVKDWFDPPLTAEEIKDDSVCLWL